MKPSTLRVRMLSTAFLLAVSVTTATAAPSTKVTASSTFDIQFPPRMSASKAAAKQKRRRTGRKRGSSSSSSSGTSHEGYMGCLGMSTDDLQQTWIFNSDVPDCSYVYHSGKGGKGSGKGKNWWSYINGGKGGSSGKGSGGSSSSGGGSANDDYTSGGSSSGGSSSGGSSSSGSSSGGSSSGGSGNNGGGNNGGGNNGGGGSNNGGGGDDDGGSYNADSYGGNGGGGGGDDTYLDTDDRAYDQTVTNEDFDDVGAGDDTYNYQNDDGDDQVDGSNGYNWDDDDDYFGNDDDNGGGGGNGGGGNYAYDDDVAEAQQNIEEVTDDVAYTTDFDPYNDFDLDVCDTYENLWVWDLSLTCETEGDLSNCECIFAEELIEEGYLSCGQMVRDCPSSCRVCHTCSKLMGCPTDASARVEAILTQSPIVILVAALGIFCVGIVYYCARMRRNDDGEMAARLMQDENNGENVWLAPDTTPNEITVVHKKLEPTTSVYKSELIKIAPTTNSPNVWLVPDAPVSEEQPSQSQEEKLHIETGALGSDNNGTTSGILGISSRDTSSDNLVGIANYMVGADGPSYSSYCNESDGGSHHDVSMVEQASPGLGNDSMSTVGPKGTSFPLNDSIVFVSQNASLTRISGGLDDSIRDSQEGKLIAMSANTSLLDGTPKKDISNASDDVVSVSEGHVWLVPDVGVSAQFRPSHDAALSLPHHPTDEHENEDDNVWLAPIV